MGDRLHAAAGTPRLTAGTGSDDLDPFTLVAINLPGRPDGLNLIKSLLQSSGIVNNCLSSPTLQLQRALRRFTSRKLSGRPAPLQRASLSFDAGYIDEHQSATEPVPAGLEHHGRVQHGGRIARLGSPPRFVAPDAPRSADGSWTPKNSVLRRFRRVGKDDSGDRLPIKPPLGVPNTRLPTDRVKIDSTSGSSKHGVSRLVGVQTDGP